MNDMPRPPFDPLLAERLFAMPQLPPLDDAELAVERPLFAQGYAAIADTVDRLGLIHEERSIPGADGQAMTVSIIRPAETPVGAPVMYTIHGGGGVMGDRYFMMEGIGQLDWVARWGVVLITPEYRLAPEHPDPAAREDGYAGLLWAVDHAGALGIDPGRIIVGGASSGGGLAAGITLLTRDRQGPPLLGQMLICPQLDHRNDTVSARQYTYDSGLGGLCAWENNEFEWDAILGPGHRDRDVSAYASPAIAPELAGLPTTFIDVGGSELFRDEAVAYASRLWEAGVTAELHVWPGGFHGFDIFAPDVPVSLAAHDARDAWLRRTWGL